MPDPSHSYGWRDFSERSSFGNLREWGYGAISYNPDAKVYREGIKRIREFGIEIDDVTTKDLINDNNFIYGIKLNNIARNNFYSMSSVRIKELSDKYNIDYVIMDKRYGEKPFLKSVYENKHFYIYEPTIRKSTEKG